MITPLPTPAPSRSDTDEEFIVNADRQVAAFPQMVTEINLAITDITAKQETASTAATTATTKAAEAVASANAAALSAPAYNAGSSYIYPQIMAFTDGQTYRCVSVTATAAGQSPVTHPAKWVLLSLGNTLGSTVDVWLKDSSAAERQRFNSSGTTNIKGYGATPLAVQNATDLDSFLVLNSGAVESRTKAANPKELTQLGQVQDSSSQVAVATGTADALLAAFTPPITTLTQGLTVLVRAIGTTTLTNPTLKADATAAIGIVKGANTPLAVADVQGAGHWLELQYDATLTKWVLQNPATGVTHPWDDPISDVSRMDVMALPDWSVGEDHYMSQVVRTRGNQLVGWGRGDGYGTPGGIENLFIKATAYAFSPEIPTGVTIIGHTTVGGTTTVCWLSNGWAYSSGLNTRGVNGQGHTSPRIVMERVAYFFDNGISIEKVVLAGNRVDTQYQYAYWLEKNTGGSTGRVFFTGYTDGGGAAGDGSAATRNITTPQRCGSISGIVDLYSGGDTSAGAHAWDSTGNCYFWGWQPYGHGGIGTTSAQLSPQVLTGMLVEKVVSFTGVNSTPATYDFSLFLMKDGTVKAAGRNLYGQLGNSSTTDSSSPVAVTGLTSVTKVGCTGGDWGYSWAITSDKFLHVWGMNGAGQLGVGDNTSRSSPTLPVGYISKSMVTTATGNPPFQGKVSQVIHSRTNATGFSHSIIGVLDEDGSVWVAGHNNGGLMPSPGAQNRFHQILVPQLPPGDKVVEISHHGHGVSNLTRIFARTLRGRLLCIGDNSYSVATGVWSPTSLVRTFTEIKL